MATASCSFDSASVLRGPHSPPSLLARVRVFVRTRKLIGCSDARIEMIGISQCLPASQPASVTFVLRPRVTDSPDSAVLRYNWRKYALSAKPPASCTFRDAKNLFISLILFLKIILETQSK